MEVSRRAWLSWPETMNAACQRNVSLQRFVPVCLTSHDYKANIITAPLVPVIDTALLRQKENYFDPCLLLRIFFLCNKLRSNNIRVNFRIIQRTKPFRKADGLIWVWHADHATGAAPSFFLCKTIKWYK